MTGENNKKNKHSFKIDRLIRLPAYKKAVYDVEREVISWADLHARFYLTRYALGGRHWKQGEERTTYVGLLGQKIFDVILQQLEVSKDHNDPVIDWRQKKRYDFKIPTLGTVEVKAFDYYCKKVLIKVSEWHGNDYCVVFKFMDKKPIEVHMEGWLTKEEVERLPVSKKGEYYEGKCYTPFADAYITNFDKLNPSNQFIFMLISAREEMGKESKRFS